MLLNIFDNYVSKRVRETPSLQLDLEWYCCLFYR